MPEVQVTTTAPVINIDTPLSVPLLVMYLQRGYSYARIGRLCNKSREAVRAYVERHYDDLGPLVEDDRLFALRCKALAGQAQDKITDLIDDADAKALMALNAISGTHIDKYRLLTGQSTVIVAPATKEIEELQAALQAYEERERATIDVSAPQDVVSEADCHTSGADKPESSISDEP